MDDLFDKVIDYANVAKDEASKIAKQMVGKTSDIMNQAKLNFAIGETESKMKEIYVQIGEKAYNRYVEGVTLCECMKEQFEKLDELKKELDALNERYTELKKSVKCPKCGADNVKNAKYCVNCGALIVEDVAAAEVFEDDSDDNVIIINPKKNKKVEETEE